MAAICAVRWENVGTDDLVAIARAIKDAQAKTAAAETSSGSAQVVQAGGG